MADDDRALMDRLAALEAEVKADADAQQARKAAALAKVREQRVTQAADRDALRARQAELIGKRRAEPDPEPAAKPRRADPLEDLGGALQLAGKANEVKQELTRPRKRGDKSWKISGVASLALGPIGWLYAGSLRETVPAATAWTLLAVLASKILPALLLWPALMVVMPLSAIAGVVYAMQYNRSGKRQRLFGGAKPGPGDAARKQLR